MKNSIIVQNLKCGGCAHTITTKVEALPHVSNVTVNIETSTVSFITATSDDALMVKSKLKALGYPSIDEANNTFSKAKSFVSCGTGKLT